MFFHILSDIHLEFLQTVETLNDLIKIYPFLYENINRDENKDKYLILAGDIGYPTSSNYHTFLQSCSEEYKDVFCIFGNHEYYHAEMNFIENYVCEIFKDLANVHFLLNKEYFLTDDVVLIGTTLWTNIDKNSRYIVQSSMNDYNSIQKDKKCLTIDDTNNLHELSIKFLEECIKKNENKKVIIITHHLPTKKLIHEKYYSYGSINKAFYTDLEKFIEKHTKTIKLWICGHSHSSKEEAIQETNLILNPIGYIHERKRDAEIIRIKEVELK